MGAHWILTDHPTPTHHEGVTISRLNRGIAAALVCAWAGSAFAADAPRTLEDGAPPAAEQRYQVGLNLYQAGNYLGAATEFRGALPMFPTS